MALNLPTLKCRRYTGYMIESFKIIKGIHDVIYIWNSRYNYVVSADTVNTFNHCLDKFWCNQEVQSRSRWHQKPEYDK